MNKHRIGALVAAAALTLTFAGTAFANDLHQDTPITGTDFKNTEVGCDEGWHFVHTETDGRLPIIGVGGVMCADDASRLFDAGASLVQLYSGFIYHGPALVRSVARAAASQ